MSYILDALKKSEKERRRGKQQDETSENDPVVLEKKKHPLLPYFFGAVLLLNASILLFWFGPWHTRESHVAVETHRQQIDEPHIGNMRSGLSENRSEDNKVIGSTSKMTEAKLLPDTGHSREQSIKQATAGGKAEKSQDVPRVPLTDDTPAESARDGDIPPPDINRLYNLNDLPSPVKQNLPEFSVSVFLYSNDPDSRLARINGQSLKEGQYLSEGLKLEEIVPDGVIFSYRKYRFHLCLK